MRYTYLDNNATTPCDDVVLSAMLPFFRERYANPSSPHALAKDALTACSDARERAAQLLGCTGSEIVFTSGATESNNVLLLGFVVLNRQRRRIVTSQIEHKSVLLPCRVRKRQDVDVREIGVTTDGVVNLDSAAELIDDSTALVSVQAANNETGVLQPIQELAEIAHSRSALFHCDASQWIGKLPLPAWVDQCDYLSISGHKFYGPKGAGILTVRNGRPRRSLAPITYGGGHEAALRSGTPNVPSIVGLGIACDLAGERAARDEVDVASLRERFESAVTSTITSARINGVRTGRLPGSCSLTIPGVPASMLIANLSGICIGEGSACATGAVEPSHVLVAMGLSREDADSTVRISFGRQNKAEDADLAARSIADAATYILDRLGIEPGANATCAEGPIR